MGPGPVPRIGCGNGGLEENGDGGFSAGVRVVGAPALPSRWREWNRRPRCATLRLHGACPPSEREAAMNTVRTIVVTAALAVAVAGCKSSEKPAAQAQAAPAPAQAQPQGPLTYEDSFEATVT